MKNALKAAIADLGIRSWTDVRDLSIGLLIFLVVLALMALGTGSP